MPINTVVFLLSEPRNCFDSTIPIRSHLHQNVDFLKEETQRRVIRGVNGSLESHLEDESRRRCLTWAKRLKICIGAAIGLKHLKASHGEDKILVHRNFNSGNIRLDDNMEPLICALGFSIVLDRNKGQVHGIPVYNEYYIDPIYEESGIIRTEIDIYSLGVVLFEMLTGMLACFKWAIEEHEQSQYLIHLVRRYSYDDGLVKLIDPVIKDQIDIHSFLIFKEIASKCISLNFKDRPSLNRIIKRLEEALRIQEQGDASTIATRSQLSRQDKKLEDFRVPLKEINEATGNFSNKTWIGKGGFGVVYKGQSSKSWQNCTVAIKRLNPKGHQGNDEFQNELNMMFRFHHHNIINFIGYCDEDNEMIIVNEYASNDAERESVPCGGTARAPQATAKVTGDGSDRGLGENLCPLGEQLEPEATEKVTGDGSD
ncbi:serine/threonine/dual specificity protein kinase, catalytic domain-containing protein [Artemisia annua]|uniref:Serine/threonine/dual specificity protein kinase, catalytic domain-containing protein n=1 Tax=Artemisia annua TaxID=35608 RepID=A0A2U1N659_ARTAN|nr:serine/threonine/dual specificity protein kinase, catalytic domain-containing protein [Artemisia annua]